MPTSIATACLHEYEADPRGRRRPFCDVCAEDPSQWAKARRRYGCGHRGPWYPRGTTLKLCPVCIDHLMRPRPCAFCGAQWVPSSAARARGTFCSTRCSHASRGEMLPAPIEPRTCALAECDEVFTPMFRHQRCCCERHGKLLYNRESRASGRQKPEPWNDRRKAAWKARRALKRGALAPAEPFRYVDVFERDGWMCGICDEAVDPELQYPDPLSASLDHVIPLSKGGAHSPSNAQCAHLRCNLAKGVKVA